MVTDLDKDDEDVQPHNSDIDRSDKDLLCQAKGETGLPEVSTIGLPGPDVVSRAYIPITKTE